MYLTTLISVTLLVLVIILLSRVNVLTTRLQNLQERMDRLEGKKAPLPAPDARPVEKPPSMGPPIARKPSRTREEWEALIGGKVLNRIGALAIIIAVGLFLKYAFDQNLISETVRVLVGGAAGILALAGAYQTRTKGYEIFAQGLVGAGIGILYLSVYASFNFYQLVPQWVAFVLMGVVTMVTLVHGVSYNSLAVALLGWVGGFLTPILLSTGISNEIGLFSYVTLLDLGLLGILLVRGRWWVLEPLTFAATWMLFGVWYMQQYMPDDLLLTLFFVLLFWGMFFGMDVLRLSRDSQASSLGTVLGSANAVVTFLALYALIDADYHAWMGLVTLLFGVAYLMTFLSALRKQEIGRGLEMRYVLTSIALAAIAVGIQFSGLETVVAWSIMSVGIVWGSQRWIRPYIFHAGAVVLAFAFIKFFHEQNLVQWAGTEEVQLLLNLRSLALVSLFGASLVNAIFVASGEGRAAQAVRSLLYYGAALSVLMLLTLELNEFFRGKLSGLQGDEWRHVAYTHVHTSAVVMALYTVPLLWVGVRRNMHPFIVSGTAVLLLASLLAIVRGFEYEPQEYYTPIENVRVVGLLMVAIIGAWQVRMLGLKRGVFRWISGGQLAVRMLVVVVVFALLTGEVLDFFGQQLQYSDLEEARAHLANLRQLWISGTWVLYSAALMAFGLWRAIRAIRVAAFVLFGISILKIFIYDLSFLETLYRIFSFIALGVVLLAVSYAYQRFRHIIFGVAPAGPTGGS